MSNKRKTALVTGASSGIGRAFCERLARDGFDLTIVARRKDRLLALADELNNVFNTKVEVLVADLAQRDGMKVVEARLSGDPAIDLLINNAGFINYGPFVEHDRNSESDCVEVMCQAVMRLTHAALPGMLARGRGGVQVASRAGLQPHTQTATYSAAKAFVVAFTQVLHGDYTDQGLRFQALCPGATRTELLEVAGVDPAEIGIFESTWMEPQAVVAESMHDLERGELVCVPGRKGRGEWVRNWVPARWLRRASEFLRRISPT